MEFFKNSKRLSLLIALFLSFSETVLTTESSYSLAPASPLLYKFPKGGEIVIKILSEMVEFREHSRTDWPVWKQEPYSSGILESPNEVAARQIKLRAIKEKLKDPFLGPAAAISIGYALGSWEETEELYDLFHQALILFNDSNFKEIETAKADLKGRPSLETFRELSYLNQRFDALRREQDDDFKRLFGFIEGLGFAALRDPKAADILNVILSGEPGDVLHGSILRPYFNKESFQMEILMAVGRALCHSVSSGNERSKEVAIDILFLGGDRSLQAGIIERFSYMAVAETPGVVGLLLTLFQNRSSEIAALADLIHAPSVYREFERGKADEVIGVLSEVQAFILEQRRRFPLFKGKSDLFVLQVSHEGLKQHSHYGKIDRPYDVSL